MIKLEQLDFKKLKNIANLKTDLIAVVIQNYDNKEVIMIGYTNLVALKKTIETKQVFLWSSSRNELWHKGKTSGNYFRLQGINVNCENNSLLYQVSLENTGACHQKDESGKYYSSCYHQVLSQDKQ